MKGNIRFLVLSLVIMIFVLGQPCIAQRVDELIDHGTDTLTKNDVPSHQFQISLDLTSAAAGLLGGGNAQNFHFGAQVKYLKGKMGYRYHAELYPQSQFVWDNTRPIDIVDQGILYLAVNQNAWLVRSGFGIERGSESKYGRSYFGVDLPISYENKQISAFNYVSDPNSNEPVDLSFQVQTQVVQSAGLGLVPFLGYEFRPGKRIGFNIEAKADFNFMFGEGYFVDDNALITKSGTFYHFRTFPLLDFRVHYRI